jgi:hypothetical protein
MVGCPVDARSVEARRLVQFSFSACALSHVREPMVGVCALYIAQLTWVAVSPGMESRPQHRTSVGGGTAWHRCDYGEKNAEGFFVQLKLQVVCSLRTVRDRVTHSPRYTLCRLAKQGVPEKFLPPIPQCPRGLSLSCDSFHHSRPTDPLVEPIVLRHHRVLVRSVMVLPHHFMHGGSLDGGSATSLSTRPYSMQASLSPTGSALPVAQIRTKRPAVKFHLARALRLPFVQRSRCSGSTCRSAKRCSSQQMTHRSSKSALDRPCRPALCRSTVDLCRWL